MDAPNRDQLQLCCEFRGCTLGGLLKRGGWLEWGAGLRPVGLSELHWFPVGKRHLRRNVAILFRFFGLIVWIVAGLCVGGLGGAEVFAKWLAPVPPLPPPNDAAWPMLLICVLAGSAVGAILAQISAALVLVRIFPFPSKTDGPADTRL